MTVNTLHPRNTSRQVIAPATPVPATRAVPARPHRDQPTREDTEPRQIDLCGQDYYERRGRLFAALLTLEPGEEVQLVSDRADDVSWLRYEMEARIPRRYCWSLPQERLGTARTTVRLPRQRE